MLRAGLPGRGPLLQVKRPRRALRLRVGLRTAAPPGRVSARGRDRRSGDAADQDVLRRGLAASLAVGSPGGAAIGPLPVGRPVVGAGEAEAIAPRPADREQPEERIPAQHRADVVERPEVVGRPRRHLLRGFLGGVVAIRRPCRRLRPVPFHEFHRRGVPEKQPAMEGKERAQDSKQHCHQATCAHEKERAQRRKSGLDEQLPDAAAKVPASGSGVEQE
mmetsp:Transcript_59959/g.160675  ORF Transcript_59959/g.160675 Transcript_59959/m.160675 type:complete len:219 (+) Transcript_59959:502-1158(+)